MSEPFVEQVYHDRHRVGNTMVEPWFQPVKIQYIQFFLDKPWHHLPLTPAAQCCWLELCYGIVTQNVSKISNDYISQSLSLDKNTVGNCLGLLRQHSLLHKCKPTCPYNDNIHHKRHTYILNPHYVWRGTKKYVDEMIEYPVYKHACKLWDIDYAILLEIEKRAIPQKKRTRTLQEILAKNEVKT